MKAYLANALTLLYRLLLSMYPPAHRAEFADEMYATFIEGVEEAMSQGRLGRLIWRELRDTPGALAYAHWDGWRMKLQAGLQILQDTASTSDLPPAPPDGRESWRQALLESSLFMVSALFLVLATYLPNFRLSPGWQRNGEFLGRVILPLTLPFLLLGLARGLPRWAYPFGGLWLGYQLSIFYQSGMWLFLMAMLGAFSVLAAAAIVTDPQRSRLPILMRRVGQSLSLDWTRLSFGIFGAIPLVILLAFDDAHANNRTPYLALSAVVMVVSALAYGRSRAVSAQLTALFAGLTLSIWCAWMDKLSFAGGLMNWVTVPSAGVEELLWLLKLGIQAALLLLSPVVFIMVGRAVSLKRAV